MEELQLEASEEVQKRLVEAGAAATVGVAGRAKLAVCGGVVVVSG